MEYKLIVHNKQGYILTRKPEKTRGDLIITFTGAPSGATAIFENSNGDSLYRLLADNTCSLPASFLKGTISVTVTVLNGRKSPKYVCEKMYAEPIANQVLIMPDGLDVAVELVSIHGKIDTLSADITNILSQQKALNESLQKLIEGYDAI